MKKISIVIPTMSYKWSKACIESIIKYTDMDDIEIVVVANGGDFANNDLGFFPYECVKLVWYSKPLGAVKAYNKGIQAATGEYIILMNDDCEVQESVKNYWLDELLKPFSDPKMAVTGVFKMTPGLAGDELKFNEARRKYGFILFFCAVIPRRIFDDIGILDEMLECGVDVDFCMKCMDKGYKIAQVPDEELQLGGPLAIGSFPFFHQGEGTVHDFYGDKWKSILQKDAKILNDRYGIKNDVSITITAYGDRLEEVINCIESIYANTEISDVEIVVVGNYVSKRVEEYLRSLKEIKYYHFDNALGTSGAINIALQNSTGKIKIILNQDVIILGKDWLPMILEPFNDPTVGATGPLKQPITEPISDVYYNYLHGFCMAIQDSVFKEVGLFDINFNPGGFEDLDYSVRIQQAGYKIVQVPTDEVRYGEKYGFEGNYPIYHSENHGTWLSSDVYKRNYDYFFGKYKKKTSREPILPTWPVAQKKGEILQLQEFLKDYEIKKILEVGTYRGGTAMLWANIVAPVDGIVYCADLKFDWGEFQDHGYADPEVKFYRRQIYNDSPYEKYIREFQGDTHNPEFVKNISDQIGEVDFIFIDGDHSADGVRQDFNNYKHLVKNGGYIAFHDILETDYHKTFGCYVHEFWNEIKNVYKSWEFIDPNEYSGCPAKSMGIGIIQMDRSIVENKESKMNKTTYKPKVTAYISTKDRYNTTLPLAITGVASQTYKPDELILIDDGDQKDLRNDSVYSSLFKMMDELGIKWKVLFGQKKGQVANHQMMLTAENNYIWRVDDDNFPEANVLEVLMEKMLSDEKIGAIGSRSLVPGETVNYKDASSKISDLYSKPNLQWSKFPGFEEVDHLHNTFLFRKSAGSHGYHQGLSPVGHREETIFTFKMKLSGWKLMVCGDVVTWHFRQQSGGIRSFQDQSMWDNDEKLFQQWMRQQNTNPNVFLAVLDSGLGDHLDFLTLLPEIRAKYPNKVITLATCFPEVFKNELDVKQISIADAVERLGNIESHNVYKYMAENNWKTGIKDAYRALYLV